jgi:hypothetical protein
MNMQILRGLLWGKSALSGCHLQAGMLGQKEIGEGKPGKFPTFLYTGHLNLAWNFLSSSSSSSSFCPSPSFKHYGKLKDRWEKRGRETQNSLVKDLKVGDGGVGRLYSGAARAD